jgi:hypothetical protein
MASGTVRPRVPLSRIVEAFGPTLMRVLASPDQPADVADVVIYDPADNLVANEGDLVLAVGVRGVDASELSRSLAQSGVAGLVFKAPPGDTPAWLDAQPPEGLAVLGLEPDASWSYVTSLLRSLLTTATNGVDPVEDLFGLADAVSALVNGPVTIEDTSSRVLAFSGRQEEADAGRRDTIVGRRVPDHYVRLLQERGVFRWLARETAPIYIDPLSPSTQPRTAVSVRAGREVLGSMWAVVREPLGRAQERAFADAANVVALHLLRLRAEGDVASRMQSDMVATVLEGGQGAAEAATRLGIASGPLCVLAAQPLLAEPATRPRLPSSCAASSPCTAPPCAPTPPWPWSAGWCTESSPVATPTTPPTARGKRVRLTRHGHRPGAVDHPEGLSARPGVRPRIWGCRPARQPRFRRAHSGGGPTIDTGGHLRMSGSSRWSAMLRTPLGAISAALVLAFVVLAVIAPWSSATGPTPTIWPLPCRGRQGTICSERMPSVETSWIGSWWPPGCRW